MAQEIYHRSEWGNPNEQWGNVYLNADLTNELYKRASEYENSWVTDQLLNGVGTKPSIILTPTAYEDGVLNSVKPKRTLGSELVTNGTFDTDSDWTKGANWNISGGTANADGTSLGALLQLVSLAEIGKKYLLKFSISNYTSGNIRVYYGGVFTDFVTANGDYTQTITAISTDGNFQTSMSSAFTGSIDNVSLKELTEADFDFTRGSSATRVNELGLVQDVQLLSGELVQNGNFEQIGSELVTNGDFATDSDWSKQTGWTISGGTANCDGLSGASYLFQNIGASTIGTTYKIQLDVSNYISGTLVAAYGGTSAASITSNGSYTFYVKTTSTDANTSYLSYNFEGSIDNVSVKEVGQNWTFGNGWSIEDGKAVFDDVTTYFFSQTGLSIISGKKYKIGFTIADCPTTAHMTVYDSGGSDLILANENYVNGSYVRYYTATTNESGISFWGNTVGDTFSITNISVVEITDDTDLPRINYTNFDYEDGEVVPYSGEGSLLLEPQSTNLETKSNGFSTWSLNANITRTVGYIISPDGTQNATRLQFTAGGYTANTTQTASAQITVSCYAKRNDSGTQSVGFFKNGSGVVDSAWSLTSEWKRFTYTYTSSNGSYVGIASVSGADISVFGFQIEQLSYATSYIPTESSIKTRLQDAAFGAGSSDLINSTEGVLYAEISANDNVSGRWISLSNGTTNERISIAFQANDIRLYIRNTSGLIWDYTYTSANIFNYNKIGLKYKSGDYALWINGIEVATDSNSNLASNLSGLQFDSGGGSSNFYGNVKCLAVFKEALSDTELQKLTQV